VPFTYLHFGVALPFILWDWKKKRIDAISALLGTIIVDIRAIYLYLFKSSPYHGFLHSFFSAIILGILVGIFVHLTRNQWNVLLKRVKWEQNTSLMSKIFVACIFTISHILLDGALYGEGSFDPMEPLWPFASGNFLFLWLKSSTVFAICYYGFFIGFVLYTFYLIWYFNPKNKLNTEKSLQNDS